MPMATCWYFLNNKFSFYIIWQKVRQKPEDGDIRLNTINGIYHTITDMPVLEKGENKNTWRKTLHARLEPTPPR